MLADTFLSSRIKCSGPVINLEDVDYDERRSIKWRCCDTDLPFENAMICKSHKEKLGKKFTKMTNSCFWPEHHKSWAFVRPYRVEKEESFYLYQNFGIFLPFKSKVCMKCMSNYYNEKLKEKNFKKEDYPTPKSQVSLLDLGERDDPMVIDDDPNDLDFDPPNVGDDTIANDDPKAEALHNLLEVNDFNLDKDTLKILDKPYARAGKTRQWQLKKLVSAGIAAVIHSATTFKKDDTLIYKEVIESDYVEANLVGRKMPSEDLVASIREYNHAPTSSARLQIYSRLAVRFGFKKLSRYNSPSNFQTHLDGSEIEDDEETEPLDYEPNEIGVYWFPSINPYFHQKAVKHFYRAGYSTAPVVEKQTCRWRQMESVVDEITTFVMDHCTESLAYGVKDVIVRTPEGVKKVPIVKTYRRQNDEDLTNMIIAHLKDKDLPIPSKSYIKKLLREAMPAEKTKEVCGVNSFAEDANEGFQQLRKVLEDMRPNIGEENFKNIDTNLAKVKTYLKSHYAQNLAMTSSVISHCASHACSDPSNPNLQFDCEDSHIHNEECDWCTQLNQTFDVFCGLLAEYSNTIECEIKRDILLEDTEEALKNIARYQSHLVKAFIQKDAWMKRFEELDEANIFVTSDWSQKMNPKQHREKQSEYFGKRGISMHITVVEKLKSEKDERGNIKKYNIETDTYASIIDKDSIQDSQAVVAIILANLADYKKLHPEVKRAFLRSDCAGCYKSSKCLEAMWQKSISIPGLCIAAWIFSAPQAGKSKCDTVSMHESLLL